MLVSATLALVALALPATAGAAREYSLDAPRVVLRGTPFTVGVEVPEAGIAIPLNVRVDGRSFPVVADDDGGLVARVESASTGSVVLELTDTGASLASATTRLIPAWVSVVPPIIAIVAALVFRQVIPALFFGLFFGSVAVIGFGPTGIFVGLLEAFQVYVVEALVDPDHAAIILFSFMIGGMVGIITKNGGMQGVVDHMVKWATSPRRGQTTTALLGLAIFFDDYANTLVVGNTMRQVTDRLRISCEKLAYIVDSTAAPVSCVALVTTWIGYEVGLIDAAIGQIAELDMAAYSVFLSSIPYSFYPLLTMFFVLAVANTGRDFGPMLAAETRARTTGQVMAENANVDERAADARELDPKTDKPHRAINAVLPIAVLIVGVLSGIYVTGEGDTLRDIVASTDSYTALLWASLLGAVTAAVLSGLQRILTLSETMDAWYAGRALDVLRDDHPGAGLVAVVGVGRSPHRRLPDFRARRFVNPGTRAFHRLRARRAHGLRHGFELGDHGYLDAPGGAAGLGGAANQRHGAAAAFPHPVLDGFLRACRGGSRRSLLADFRYDDPVVDGVGVRSRRSRTHTAALRSVGGRGCGAARIVPGRLRRAVVDRAPGRSRCSLRRLALPGYRGRAAGAIGGLSALVVFSK